MIALCAYELNVITDVFYIVQMEGMNEFEENLSTEFLPSSVNDEKKLENYIKLSFILTAIQPELDNEQLK